MVQKFNAMNKIFHVRIATFGLSVINNMIFKFGLIILSSTSTICQTCDRTSIKNVVMLCQGMTSILYFILTATKPTKISKNNATLMDHINTNSFIDSRLTTRILKVNV